MPQAVTPFRSLPPDVCQRAVNAHDPRFDGLFFVGIVTTHIYCRPVCPSRTATATNRRFFLSAPAAERAGFRPCLRCRPELAPGRAPMDATSRLAVAAARRIAAGGLNGRSVAELAGDLEVSERHLRRALRSELGVSPLELAQTHRLLLAKRLLADTELPAIQIAFASGFQSLRRFNVVFRERYRMSPSRLRSITGPVRTRVRNGDPGRNGDAKRNGDTETPRPGLLRTTLSYRPPLAWDALVGVLAREALPGVEIVDGRRYGRTVEIGGRKGVVFAEDTAPGSHLTIDVSPSLAPVLMPLIARLRQLFDLDAVPTMVDACLEEGGLGAFVQKQPGLRIPGALDGFEIALREILRGRARPGTAASGQVERMMAELSEPFVGGIPGLSGLAPSAERVAGVGVSRLAALGVPRPRAGALVAVARRIAEGDLSLEPGSDAAQARRELMEIDGVGEGIATAIVMRAMSWPDAFAPSDPALGRAAGTSSAAELRRRAEAWRPWRSYAALHLWLADENP